MGHFQLLPLFDDVLQGMTHEKHWLLELFEKISLLPCDFYVSFFTNRERHRMRGPTRGM